MVQVPTPTMLAVVPETVQTPVVFEVKLTARPELAEALSETDPPYVWLGIGAKVIVWLPCWAVPLRLMVCVAALPLRLLFVRTAWPCTAPTLAGVKAMLR